MTGVPPKIDARTLEDLVAQTASLAEDYTRPGASSAGREDSSEEVPSAGWSQPDPDQPDLGYTLIRLFARMASQVIERLNQVPEKNHLAFLNLLGAERMPPRPARAPLTFQLAAGATQEVVVPAGTLVAAPAVGSLQEAVFETERELFLSRAALTEVVVWEPPSSTLEAGIPQADKPADKTALTPLGKYADRTASATAAAPGGFKPFAADHSGRQCLYLALDQQLELPGVLGCALELEALSGSWSGAILEWSSWDGQQWGTLGDSHLTFMGESRRTLRLEGVLPGQLKPCLIEGQQARWLRARLVGMTATDRPCLADRVTCLAEVTVSRADLPCSLAFFNGIPVDATLSFKPFGDAPQREDCLYLACDEALAAPGSRVTLKMTLTGATPLRASQDLRVAWEVWDGMEWITLGWSSPAGVIGGRCQGFEDTTRAFTQSGMVTLPAYPRDFTTVSGQRAAWVRVRLASGSYGQEARLVENPDIEKRALSPWVWSPATLTPPSIDSLEIGYTSVSRQAVQACWRGNGGERADCTAASHPGSSGFTPFVWRDDTSPASYLGFDRPLENRPISLFLEVLPASAAEVTVRALETAKLPSSPVVIWEYRSTRGWLPLAVTDETRALATSGQVLFVGPPDASLSLEFGRNRFWIRARLLEGGYRIPPRLGRVLINTTWAAHVTSHAQEVLGSSDGTPNQTFQLSHTPVLAGQRIEIREPQPPRLAERNALTQEEGPDALTVIPGAPGQQGGVWVRWHAVTDFYASGPTDRHYLLDHETGAIRFGDGHSGRIPPQGRENVRATTYQTGGGLAGNRPAGVITQLKGALPYLDKAWNPLPASGGAELEPLSAVKRRAGRRLRHRDRATALEDFEDLAFEASSQVVRARAFGPLFDPIQQGDAPRLETARGVGQVTVIVVPKVDTPRPTPDPELIRQIEAYLRARCAPAVRLLVAGPDWVEVVVKATLAPQPGTTDPFLLDRVRLTIEQYLHPLTGGRDGHGWPFGRLPAESDLFALISAVKGVDHLESLDIDWCVADGNTRLELRRPGDPAPVTTDALEARRLIPWHLVCSGNHQLRLAAAGRSTTSC